MDVGIIIIFFVVELGNLLEIELSICIMSVIVNGWEVLIKVIMIDDYILMLIFFVSMVEDFESFQDLYCLCNIMKQIIFLNDMMIIEYVVLDECILGVVGVFEYDFDFFSYKVNYCQWFNN